MGGIVRGQKSTLLKVGGIEDHVHLLLCLNPTVNVSDMVGKIKSNSSRWINQRDDVKCKFEWQPGYAAFTVSESQAPVVAKYIANQAEHHRKRGFKEEYLAMLKKHQIEYDLKYIFEEEG